MKPWKTLTMGAADQIARQLQGLIQQNDLSPRPFIPINKAGGSGAEALSYMKGKEGNNHTLLVALNSFYTTPIIQEDLEINVTTFAPVGRMAMDTFLLWVNTDHDDITDLDSYVATVNNPSEQMEFWADTSCDQAMTAPPHW